jgi:hypothetical protein
MSGTAQIVRVAAKGEGATADGRYVALSAPGDILEADGSLTWGPNHVEPSCRHFPACGGCQLQHLSDAALADYVTARVAGPRAGRISIRARWSPRIFRPRARGGARCFMGRPSGAGSCWVSASRARTRPSTCANAR